MTFPNLSGLRIGAVTKFEFNPSLAIVARDVNKLGMDIRSFREPLQRAIKEVMIPSFRKNFDEGGRPAWEPLTAETIKLRQGKGSGPLVRSGALRRNMGYQSLWTITQEYAAIMDLPQRVWYGKVQQSGMHSGERVKIPARPFVVMQPEDEDAVQEVFANWLEERIIARRLG